MNNGFYQRFLNAHLLGFTTKKCNNEFYWPEALGYKTTIEIVDKENYIVRCFGNKGHMIEETPYKNDLMHGMCRRWYEDGRPCYMFICVDGKWEGAHKAYYKNGKTKWEENYDDGLKHGPCRSYSEDGILEEELYFKCGKLVKKS